MTYDLEMFVRAALDKKISKPDIRAELLKGGWDREEVDAVLNLFMESDFPIAVPRRKPSLSAREAFLYLVLFLTLYVSAISIGTLLFQFVNRWIPDPLQAANFSITGITSIIRNATASLTIAFPVFLLVSWILSRAMRRDPAKRSSGVRRWLTYITLFIAAGVMIGDLITLLNNVLSGDLTTQFILKVLIVLVIAGIIFGFYLWNLRQEEKEKPEKESTKSRPRISFFLAVILILVLATLIGGFYFSGSPSTERARRFDWERAQSLQQISYAMDTYWLRYNHQLPSSLDALIAGLSDPTSQYYLPATSLRDPLTQTPYEYRAMTTSTYELCATFATAGNIMEDEGGGFKSAPMGMMNDMANPLWRHEQGRTCFGLRIREPLKP